jgi:hypothetical protein
MRETCHDLSLMSIGLTGRPSPADGEADGIMAVGISSPIPPEFYDYPTQ